MGFIGTIHSDRAKILYKLAKQCEEQDIRYYYYLYVPGKLMLMIRRIFDTNVRHLSKYIYTVPLNKEKASEILADTNYIIDINHPKQVGLTMRTIEMLGLERKIITTNAYIKDYDFYDSQSQIYVDRDDVNINRAQFIYTYNTVSPDVYNKYTIEYWTNEIFD